MSETKVSKKQQAKKRNMRNTVIMAVLSVVLLSSATFAWFTLSNTAKITNLSLSVNEASDLMIASVPDSGDPDYNSLLELQVPADTILKPATLGQFDTITTDTMLKDVRDVNDIDKVVAYEAVDTATEVIKEGDTYDEQKSYYYFEKEFYLKSNGTTSLGIALQKGEFTGDKATDGTYVAKNVNDEPVQVTTETEYTAAAALKIAFFNEAGKVLAVYEPNTNNNAGNNADAISATVELADSKTLTGYTENVITQKMDGTFADADTSNVLFNLTSGKDCKVIMRVYIDGEDKECVNQISLSEILGNLKFVTTTTSQTATTL